MYFVFCYVICLKPEYACRKYKWSLLFVPLFAISDVLFHLMSLFSLSLFASLSRMCVSECPSGFFRDDRKRCKKCSSLCETCVGSRSDQCTTCRTGFHLNEGSNTCVANCADNFYLDRGTFHRRPSLFTHDGAPCKSRMCF